MNIMSGLVITTVLLLLSAPTSANEIYINQVGNNTDLTISQDGEDNTIGSLSGGTGKATINGNNTSTTYS